MAKKKAGKEVTRLIDTPEARELAAPVSRNVQISGVTLLHCSVQRDPSVEARDQTVHVSHDCNTEQHGKYVAVMMIFRVHTERESQPSGLVISAGFLLTYELKVHEDYPQTNLDAFGNLNGVFNAWPYVREFVQSMSTRMGAGALTLPVFRPPAAQSQAQARIKGNASQPKLTAQPKLVTKKAPKRKS